MPLREPKATLVVLLKSGASITTKTIEEKKGVELAYKNAKEAAREKECVDFRVEVGDDKDNIMYFRVEEISLISFMDYIDEKKAAQNAGLIVPPHLRQ